MQVTEGAANEAPELPQLIANTAARFKFVEVSADKGYISKNNLQAIVVVGGTPYIPFKSNHTGDKGPELWKKMYHYYKFKEEDFLADYHRRSNVESTFAMIKAKFGERVRSKTVAAQVNEVLCKVVCHNLCVLVQSFYELGIEPVFWAETSDAQKIKPKA